MENTKFENYDCQADFYEQLDEAKKKIPRPVVLICGYTGSGKTTILQSIFGKDIVGDDKIGHADPTTQDYDVYENTFIKIYDSKGLESDNGEDEFISRTKSFIRKKQQQSENTADHIHVYWYIISGHGARVTDTDLKIIDLFNKESTIVIISQKDIAKPQQIIAIRKKLEDNGIANNKIIAVSEPKEGQNIGEGIKALEKLTYNIMPEAYKAAWDEAQKIDIEKKLHAVNDKKNKAVGIITTASLAAMAAGAIPIPVAGTVIITPVQIGMIASLAALYEVGIKKEAFLPMVASICVRQTVVSLLKFIPVIGTIAGGVISVGMAVFFTAGIGLFMQNQFENIAIARAKNEPEPPIIFNPKKAIQFIKVNKSTIDSLINTAKK